MKLANAQGRGLATAIGALALIGAGAAHAGEVDVAVTGVKAAQGHVRVAICTRETFLTARCPYWAAAPARPGVTVVRVVGVPPGVYAAQVFHDEADTGVLHKNLIGIPDEPIGFSNDAPIRLTGLRFGEAAFTVPSGGARITLKLRRLFGD